MFYRIDRLEEDGTKSYEYVLGKRNLGKWCYEIIAHDKLEIIDIVKLVPSWKAFKVCRSHLISFKNNQAAYLTK